MALSSASLAQGVLPHVWTELPIELRYHTPAADLYRRQLHAKLNGDEVPSELQRVKLPQTQLVQQAPGRVSKWTADADAHACELCRASFSLFVRRHHCRKCGRCVCSECSPQQCFRPLPELGFTQNVRHCRLCVAPQARLTAAMAAELARGA
mmetsp:Transcript_3245/g.5456  ORF Transcript_3245/g.5456 Transcript_3245/m.5456 type:complete len:152 (-) Transcript_3245:136-591(-)